MKLLVVEDEPRMLELLRQGLSEEGHTVSCAADGIAGLQMVQEHDFDVVILDVMMPKMDGFELAKRMRTENNSTPVLMLTAKDSVPERPQVPEQAAFRQEPASGPKRFRGAGSLRS